MPRRYKFITWGIIWSININFYDNCKSEGLLKSCYRFTAILLSVDEPKGNRTIDVPQNAVVKKFQFGKRRRKIKPRNPSLLVTDHKTHQQIFIFRWGFSFLFYWSMRSWQRARRSWLQSLALMGEFNHLSEQHASAPAIQQDSGERQGLFLDTGDPQAN